MDMIDMDRAVAERHSVRKYTDKKIEGEAKDILAAEIDECNKEKGLFFELFTDSPGMFDGFLARSFENVNNYVVLGKKKDASDVTVGYYGEKVVLCAQRLGMNTCWVGLTYSKKKIKARVPDDVEIVCVLSIGYGKEQGAPHQSKPAAEVSKCDGDMPEWFKKGVEYALLAPTAMNKQKFRFILGKDGRVKAETAGGSYTQVDLGIAKCHFEIGAGKDNFEWA